VAAGSVQLATLYPRSSLERVHAESCSDNSSIMRTVELSLTNVFKRFVGRVCDLAETRALRPARDGNRGSGTPKCLSP
jgi:hypothetical protein